MLSLNHRALAALITGIALALAACGEKEKELTEEQAESMAASSRLTPPVPKEPLVTPNESGEIRYTGETEAGESFSAQIGGDVELPGLFGSDVPAYPGAVPTSAMETGGGTAIAALDSDAGVDDITDFYREQLSGNGWSIQSEYNLGRGKFLTATKDGRRLMVNAEGMDQGSRVTLTIGPAT
jgi:hypothetical protein